MIMEALNNVTRHAKADLVCLFFESSPRDLIIKIRDNGEGFDTQEKRSGGLGIQIMRDRANIMGGLLEIHSSPGAGTEIVFRLEKKI
jgi:signal transduction histidine kinase